MSELATTPSIATGRSLPVPLAGLAKGGMGGLFERLGAIARQPAVAKSLPMIGMVALLGMAALAWAILHQPPQRDLFSGLADADKASVAQALDTAGIKYHLDNATGELTVPEDSYYRAKMLLAQQGLPKAAPNGDELISSLPMGASRAVEGERLREAREQDLARTIEAIDAVETARVHLAVEQQSVFLRDDSKPQASVMLTLRNGRTLSDSQVQAIIHLVASSVSGLSPDDVSVVDQAGRLLSRSANGGNDALDRQVALQNQVEDRYRQALVSLLTPIVGSGNFTAEVHADLDFAQTASTTETYPKDGAVVRTEQGSWSNDQNGANQPASGIPGALSNTPPQAATPSATPNGQPAPGAAAAAGGPVAPGTAPGQASAGVPQKLNETYNRSYEVGHQISVTQNPVGAVRRLSVAVALRQTGKPLSKEQQQQIESLVKGAVGFDQARGDMVAVTQQSFADADAASQGPKWYQASWIGPVGRNLTALVVAALLVFGIGRPLMKRRAAIAEQTAKTRARERAVIGREMAQALTQQQEDAPGDRPVTLDMIESAPGYAARAALIRNFVRQDPARAALVVRDLIRADNPKAEKADA
ncbi:MAG TPA: flagellar basal-body MS-ring/collar protein FliF [Sphingomonas sp.]|nr:flagellar basal-body MS-ring/collar protein FliF [Sphingomonas sp.]